MGKNKSSEPNESAQGESSSVESPRGSKKPIVATCNNCKGKTSDAFPVFTDAEAMDLCLHKDGCPGGHDDRAFDFS